MRNAILAALCGILLGGCDPWAALCDAALEHYWAECTEQGPGSDACNWIDQHATVAGTCH